ncbi:MAG TPA: CHAD domain-containing protein [Bryobacteraceae bacterium]
MHHTHWEEPSGPAVNARRHLPALVTAYFTEVRDRLMDHPSPRKLHMLRLATKRLRYTLEVFRPCYGPGLETRMSELRHVQELLGEVNDSVAAWKLLSKSMEASPQRKQAEKFLKERSEKKAQEFREHWVEVFDAPGRERWWTGYLGREARTPGRIR